MADFSEKIFLKFEKLPAFKRYSAWYNQLSSRDKRAVIILGLFLSILLISFCIWQPVQNFRETSKTNYSQALSELNLINKIRNAGLQNYNTDTNLSLPEIVNSTSKKYNISFNSIDIADDNVINITSDNMVFNQLLLWLDELNLQYGVNTDAVYMEKQSEGIVSVRLKLSK